MATATMGTHPATGEAVRTTGWGIFASVTLLVLGGLNVVNGFTALDHAGYYKSQLVYDNLTFWGWVFLIWGVLELLAGGLVLAHSTIGYYLGICLAVIASIMWFFMIFAAPAGAMVGILVSLVVLFALTAGSEDVFG